MKRRRNGEKYDRNQKKRKQIISLLLAVCMTFAVAGCGDSTGGQDSAGEDVNVAGMNGQTQGGDDPAGEAAVMGRYVEEETDLSQQASDPMDLCMREDGSLVIMDRFAGMLVSEDQGATWKTETPDWFADYQADGYWISDLCMAPDGTVALKYYDGNTNAEDPVWYLVLILPDGTRVPVEAEWEGDDDYFRQVAMGDDNRIFASAGEGIYEVERDGSAKRILKLDVTPTWMWVKGDLLFIDNEWETDEAPLIYDMKAGEYIADEALTDFVSGSYSGRMYNGTDYGSMYLLPGDDDTVYVAGKQGMHRHVIGGNMMEQIVDGALSLLSNPDYYFVDAMQLGGDTFLALFAGGKLIRFTYDPNVPAVPEKC